MHPLVSFACSCAILSQALAVGQAQQSLALSNADQGSRLAGRPLYGRFLHITDPHPDPHYLKHSSTGSADDCHRGSGPAGAYGAETSDCDSPFSLINETFRWIGENLRDSVDFVVWTGDSARHDSDEQIPRTEHEVLDLNQYVVDQVMRVFGQRADVNDVGLASAPAIPVIPTIGNNDILPHNVLSAGPNAWTKRYSHVWRNFIPEEQKHAFERGGWFFVEVIPDHLAVFSLNTMYFFEKNAAVDGCADASEPGYEQMEWLRIQLQFLRERGMKAILSGHVPPARTGSKQNWDETCWQKYTLWLRRYRDVIVGAMYGHMNVDHFMIQDTHDISIDVANGAVRGANLHNATTGSDLTARSTSNYLSELKDSWSSLPTPPTGVTSEEDLAATKKGRKKRKRKDKKKRKFLDRIGGRWAERYAVAHVSPSIVPNYLPTLRVFEYNITGLQSLVLESQPRGKPSDHDLPTSNGSALAENLHNSTEPLKHKKKKKKHKKKKKLNFIIPDPPSRSSPPGPAYSAQSLTLLGFTQYYANLTFINNDFTEDTQRLTGPADVDLLEQTGRWYEGEHKGQDQLKKPSSRPNKFTFQVEYNTSGDAVYGLQDLTVQSYLTLARRIGSDTGKDSTQAPGKVSSLQLGLAVEADAASDSSIESKRRRHGKRRRRCNEAWYVFLKRAFVGVVDDDDLHDEFGPATRC